MLVGGGGRVDIPEGADWLVLLAVCVCVCVCGWVRLAKLRVHTVRG